VIKRYSHIKLLLLIVLPFFFNACNPSRRLKNGEYLLDKNHLMDKDTKIDKSEFENYIKQKPNRKILGIVRFHLWLHNLVNEDRVKRKRIRYDAKLAEKNVNRVAKGKQPKVSNHQLFGEWLLSIGEPPIIYDSLLTERSVKEIKLFLNNKGYFVSSVSDSVYHRHRKKVSIYYKIKSSAPYTINNIDYKISDEILKYYVFADTANTLILKGNNYDVDILQKERERITSELNNNGYFLFTRDYVHYQIDTTVGKRMVNITLSIKNFAQKYSNYSDSIIETPHKRFYISNIYIQPDFVSKKTDAVSKKDTLFTDDYYIVHSKKLRYKTKVLLNSVFIRKGELYQLKNVQDTYKRLSELNAFKSINIYFTQGKGDYLDCHIEMNSILKQSFTIETEGKNTSGSLGIGGSIVYQNRNLFKGAEVFELRLKAGLDAQKTLDNTSNINQFNTVEIGPEANIYIPRFLVPFKVKVSKSSNPKTIFTSSVTYQNRPDYTRYITNLSFGYTWKETAKKRHTINPLVINFVKVGLQPAFYDYLVGLHNLYILNSFSNHLATSTRYSFLYNEQDIKKRENFSFFKLNAESSGNILRGAYDLVNSIKPNTFTKDDQGSYKLLGIVYSQYLRMDVDFRYYYNSNELNKVVFRIAAGIGKPLKNFTYLPFERSFYSGGANGIRAWQSRTLGPGSYSDNGQFSYDQFGDGQLEGNVEYRFKLFKMLNGALFVDAGNTWLRQADPSRPGGDFQFDRFYKEIAIGSGAGVRADFNFFIIRFDLGIKVRDPQFAENKRWVIQNLFNPAWRNDFRETHYNTKYGFLTYNIGIGYPF
jgi:outer membrane protein assembly factor BamA